MPEIFIGEYLFRRLKQIGIETIFGVPGDYELALLDQVEPQGLAWIGTPNELVGAYAADGYARIKGAGALVTTFGPGELSALCGIGGAFTEKVPIIHIVGYPINALQKSGKILHHTLGDGDHDHYLRISNELSCATTVLRNPAIATSEIDHVLNAMLYHSQPGYIGISEDIAYSKVSDEYLNAPLVRTLAPSAPEAEAKALAEIIKTLESAKAPIVVVDGGAARLSWAEHVNPLVEALKIPFFVTSMGKGIANEESPYYKGSYAGVGSWPESVNDSVNSSDVILWLGNYPSDFNTGIFTVDVSGKTIIDLQRFSAKINHVSYDARINHILPKLASAFASHAPLPQLPIPQAIALPSHPIPTAIEHDWLWNRLSTFLSPHDLIITETGTAQAGISGTIFPSTSYGWTQTIYGSIGYAVSAASGAAIAAKETSSYKRLILITGEGSLQITVQALSLLARFGIPVVVFILNNGGYTIERFFRGWKAGYNDVDGWDYGVLAKGFAGGEGKGVKTWRVETGKELDGLMKMGTFKEGEGLRVVDMVMGVGDAPRWMRRIFEESRRRIEAGEAN